MTKNFGDDWTAKGGIREVIWLADALMQKFAKELEVNQDLLKKLGTIRNAAQRLLWGYGVFVDKDIALFALLGLTESLATVRKRLERISKGQA